METIKQWGIFETVLEEELRECVLGDNPYADYQVEATFQSEKEQKKVRGFYMGDRKFAVRFMPSFQGNYQYEISGSLTGEAPVRLKKGEFTAEEPEAGVHGPLHVQNQYHFAYADGTPYIECGTTCYAWLHQSEEMRRKTMETLSQSPFNKIRFCVFPKHYDYNLYEPDTYPYEGTPCSIENINRENFWEYTPDNPENHWDFYRFCEKHFAIMDRYIGELMEKGIEADIILFHPYDRWGFSQMGREADDFYLRYMIARYGAYRNVWWSLANEYDLFRKKTKEDFRYIAEVIVEEDCYEHLRSIHNCFNIYDFTEDWVTHCSIQRTEIYTSAALTKTWREKYGKPVVLDEVGYEGNINHFWGNLTAEEMVRLFWMAAVRGGYCGHGETYLGNLDAETGRELLWWSHGGELYGESGKRLQFLMDILKEVPGHYLKPANLRGWNDNDATAEDERYEGKYNLCYTGNYRPGFRDFYFDDHTRFQVSVIDTWNMTIEDAGVYSGKFYIDLPSRPYMAIRLQAVEQ